MNVNVSEKVENKLKEIARKNGQDAADYAGVLLEEFIAEKTGNVADGGQSEDGANVSEEYENPFAPFIGMFSSGKTDTSERMHEILYSEDFDPAEGFSVKK